MPQKWLVYSKWIYLLLSKIITYGCHHKKNGDSKLESESYETEHVGYQEEVNGQSVVKSSFSTV